MELTVEVNNRVNRTLLNSPLLYQSGTYIVAHEVARLATSKRREVAVGFHALKQHVVPHHTADSLESPPPSKTPSRRFASSAADGIVTIAVTVQHSTSSSLTKERE
jgi:hypothetical protein